MFLTILFEVLVYLLLPALTFLESNSNFIYA